jgi:hypothetical protein
MQLAKGAEVAEERLGLGNGAQAQHRFEQVLDVLRAPVVATGGHRGILPVVWGAPHRPPGPPHRCSMLKH